MKAVPTKEAAESVKRNMRHQIDDSRIPRFSEEDLEKVWPILHMAVESQNLALVRKEDLGGRR